LQTHRAAAIALVAMLWVHIKPSQHLSWALLIAGTSFYVAMFVMQLVRQLLVSTGKRLSIGRIEQVESDGESHMLEIKTARTLTIRPGTYVILTVLDWRYASFMQRHPLMVAWYDNRDDESKIYLIVKAQRGWTNRINHRLKDRKVWLDGPYGKPYDSGSSDLSEYDTVLLIAEESGILAHLLTLKTLAERLEYGSTKTQRIVLIFKTNDTYHNCMKKWFDELLTETDDKPSVSLTLRDR
jgi:NAD(P)H-flavin reductase